MGIGAAPAGDKAQDQGFVQLEGFTGRQVIGADDGRLGKKFRPTPSALGQGIFQLAADGPYIGAPGLHVFIVHGFQHGGKLAACFPDSSFRRHVLFLDQSLDGVTKIRILDHHLMDFKNAGFLFSHLLPGFFLQPLQGLDHMLLGSLEPFQFLLGIQTGVQVDFRLPFHRLHQDRAHGHPGGSPLPLYNLHGQSSLQIGFQKCFQGGSRFFFIRAFHGNRQFHAGLDAHAHQGENPFQVAGLAIAGHTAFGLEFGGFLHQHAGGTGMDALGILDGIRKLNHENDLLECREIVAYSPLYHKKTPLSHGDKGVGSG